MNNRNLLIGAFGLFALVSAYAESEDTSIARTNEEIIHEELSEWNDHSDEVNQVRTEKSGFVQGQVVEELFNSLLARTKNDAGWLSYAEPFLFEGREFSNSFDSVGGSNETVLN